ncbi:MAG TPA: sigma-70 family RNA polymerase sigma factor [Bacillales bacterium]|nr:sigma-70 family RNA polymerase sigma factor [Bacillales bacterium]
MEDAWLAAKAKKGDDEAFYALIQQHKAPLFKTAIYYLKNEPDALEAVQEVTFRAYQSIKKLNEPKYAKTWLIRIMIFYCLDEIKRRKRMLVKETEERTIEADPSLKMSLEQYTSRLADNLQVVIILKYFHDLTLTEIARVLKRPEGTVKTWLHKALGELRSMMDEEEGRHELR